MIVVVRVLAHFPNIYNIYYVQSSHHCFCIFCFSLFTYPSHFFFEYLCCISHWICVIVVVRFFFFAANTAIFFSLLSVIFPRLLLSRRLISGLSAFVLLLILLLLLVLFFSTIQFGFVFICYFFLCNSSSFSLLFFSSLFILKLFAFILSNKQTDTHTYTSSVVACQLHLNITICLALSSIAVKFCTLEYLKDKYQFLDDPIEVLIVTVSILIVVLCDV